MGASWLTFFNQELSRRQTFRQPRPSYRPSFGAPSGGGFNPMEVSRPGSRGVFDIGAAAHAPAEAANPATMPERFDFSLPFTKPAVPGPQPVIPPAPSTQGDILGSAGAAVGTTGDGYLNVANVIPWLLERTHELAKGLAESNPDNPIGAAAGVARDATGLYIAGMEQVSEVAAPILDYLPNTMRDNHLANRAKLYQAILAGQEGDFGPMNLGVWELTLPGTHNTGQEFINYRVWRDTFLHSADPEQRMEAEKQIAMISDQIDLPGSVKEAIAKHPGATPDQINGYLDSAPEGRQWSYDPGVGGMYANLAYPTSWYLGEAWLASRVPGGGRVVQERLAAEGYTTAASALGRTLSIAGKTVTVAAKLQKAMFVSGIGTAALTTSVNTIARYQGNQAAIDWLDKVTQPGEFAMNPRVQLVTGFTVNPFAGAGSLAKGTIKLASGTGNIVLNRTLGAKLLKFYTDDSMIYGQLAKMYRMGSSREFKAWNDANGFYESKGEAFDEVVGIAADDVLDRLPHEERLAFLATHSDPESLTKGVLTTYGAQVWDAIENRGDELAQRWFQHSWQYHQYPGAFNAEVAGLNARDFRMAKARTFELRQQIDAVVGYQEFLAPEGQALARQMVDGFGDSIPVAGRGGVQDLVRQFPALRKYWQGLVDPKATTVPRAAVDTMLQRASADYAAGAKQNPVRVRTGADPVIRPDSPRLDFDYAEALGTDVETVKAVSDFNLTKPDAAQANKLRDFLVAKTSMDPAEAAKFSPQEAWVAASDYFERTTQPWVEAGTRLVGAEKRMTALRTELRRLYATDASRATLQGREAIARIEREIGSLQTLTREAGDPIRTFSEDVRIERMRSRNADRVRAMDPDHLTATQERFLRRYLSDDSRGISVADDVAGRDLWDAAKDVADNQPSVTGRDAHLTELAERKVAAQEVLRGLDEIDAMATGPLGLDGGWSRLLRRVEGTWTWSGGKPPMSVGLRRSLSRYFAAKAGRRSLSSEIMTVGDEEAWGVLRDNPEAMTGLSRTQQRAIGRQLAGNEFLYRTTLDEYADRAVRNGAVTTTDEFLEKLTALADQREGLIEGGSAAALRLRNLRRTANMDVPPQYVLEAEANLDARSVVYDAEFDAVVHPQNIAAMSRILDSPDELYPALRGTIENDPILVNGAAQIALDKNVSLDTVLTDPSYAGALRRLVPEGFEAPTPGVIAEETPLDQFILQGDAESIAQRSEELRLAADGPHEPIPTTKARAQRATAGARRPSGELRRKLVASGADLSAAPSEAILADPLNRVGVDVLSVLNHGRVGTTPATISGTLELLREIEKGGATRMGFGAGVQAEAQRVANLILKDARSSAKRSGFRPGEFGPGLDPAGMAAADLELARALKIEEARSALSRSLERDVIRAGQEAESQAANAELGVLNGASAGTGGAMRAGPGRGSRISFEDGVPAETIATPRLQDLGVGKITYEPGDPLGTLQYGLKKRPKAAVVMELAQVPGLSEEFVAGRFQPWSERVWTGQVRRVFNYVFGAHPNEAVHGSVHQAFIERVARQGIDGELAEEVWTEWRHRADKSRDFEVRVDPTTGIRRHLPGDNPLYASVGNIPNGQMDAWAHEAIDSVLDARMAKGLLDPAYRTMAHTIDYSTVFRESSSNVRRFLLGEPVKIGAVTLASPVPTTLGKGLASAYGMVAHNKAATTMYYWFRFGLDVRFHAMNFFEGQLLYAGRASLRKGELDTGLLGQTEGYLRRLDTDFVNNTGYATSRSRFAWAYKTFLKEQPDALRKTVKGLQSEDPSLMQQAIRELADADPQLRDMIANTGGTPDGWVKALDDWHGKMLRTVDDSGADMVIDQAISEQIRQTPAMGEIYSALGQANKDLWRDVRSTFYGNPDRSRAERFLNSYLLFWPLSYQVKATKWMLRVMYDRAGGLPTNGAGAVILDRVAQSHQQLLATDPEYSDWYEKHETLVFMAQMLLPISPSSMGVSLNPALRSMFFERNKAVWDVGPIYTARQIPRLGEEIMVDLWPTLKDVPGVNYAAGGIYRALTGRQVPELDD